MRTFNIHLIALLLALMPTGLFAQDNVKKAFASLIDNQVVTITESHELTREPTTNAKESQCDIYHFSMPVACQSIIDNIVKAFNKDAERSYSFNKGFTDLTDEPRYVVVGTEGDRTIKVTEPKSEFIHALFLAPKSEDPTGSYRYAYAINWKEEDGKITGMLAITYATTLHARQTVIKNRLGNTRDARDADLEEQPAKKSKPTKWVDTFLSRVEALTYCTVDGSKIGFASAIYRSTNELDSDALEPSARPSLKDLTLAINVLQSMLDSNRYADPTLQALLSSAQSNLKDTLNQMNPGSGK
ncbi:MAG: hypothetical protein LIO90_01160 [Bacteroidales bacterium]|nr:hypothetical protein [Bacteroidales bacterium]